MEEERLEREREEREAREKELEEERKREEEEKQRLVLEKARQEAAYKEMIELERQKAEERSKRDNQTKAMREKNEPALRKNKVLNRVQHFFEKDASQPQSKQQAVKKDNSLAGKATNSFFTASHTQAILFSNK